ncbi:MAG: DUF2286 domain-containing protein [Candidatus Methanomethylicia archaeon]|nr:DUF2286 domain-containing protein [Candidatus Methanomethylicia archaeon]MCX8168879.1 DUF2286 domain-containing protein [Candidatus Methanomethylicia archaeon]MDW7988611.1 DUF2286 domain-containing protein [Nitrososphaerota archaeon]
MVILSENGNAQIYKELNMELEKAVKWIAKEAMDIWDLNKSDFIIIRDNYPAEIKLPLTSEEYDAYSKLKIQRTSQKTVIVELPLYIISFDNEWLDDGYKDNKVFVITLGSPLREEVKKEIIEWSKEMTKAVMGEEEEEEEEG